MPEIRITYYEDEMNDSIFEKNKCENYIQLMEKYLNEGKYYPQRGESNRPPYNDPDCNSLDFCSYYWELTQFLNERETWLKEIMKEKYEAYEYAAPVNCKKKKQGKNKYPGSDKNEIIVYCNGEEKLRLKSDQFGFSVGADQSGFDIHPYGTLCDRARVKTEDEKMRVYKVIAECIYRTRTLGGGFLWSVNANIWDEYNKKRGGSRNKWEKNRKYYIEDRVDLTLLEVKHLFEWICPDGKAREEEFFKDSKLWDRCEYRDDILFQIIKEKMQRNDSKERNDNQESKGVLDYIQWLRHFGTFANYMKFFCFDDFADKQSMPLDIVESQLQWDDERRKLNGTEKMLEEPTKYKQREAYSVYRLADEKLEQMLKNVSFLTAARSYRLQKVIDDAIK